MDYSTMAAGEFSGALYGALSKKQAAALARAHGWTGDDARTQKARLCDYIAEHVPAAERAAIMHATAEQATAEQATAAPEQATAAPEQDSSADQSAQVAQAIAGALAGLKFGADPEQIRKLVKAEIGDAAERIRKEALANVYSVRVETVQADGSTQARDMGRQHKQFPALLKMAAQRLSVFIAGEAGTGKTTAAENVARALDLPFYFNGALDTEYKLMGFVDAQGRIVSTAFRKAFTDGGVYLFDEVDASLPAALLAFNAALANGHCDFPGSEQPIKRHPDFICIAAGNTVGYGATVEYVGRNRLDAAFMDRFVKLRWEIDENLERALAGNDDWTSEVQTVRSKARAKGLKVVISPRASIYGARLIAAGFDSAEAAEHTYLFGLSKEQRAALKA